MGKGTVTSDEHVDVKLTNGTLTSDRLRITDGGEVVRFEGNVVMHLDHLDDRRRGRAAGEGRRRPSPCRHAGRERLRQVRQREVMP